MMLLRFRIWSRKGTISWQLLTSFVLLFLVVEKVRGCGPDIPPFEGFGVYLGSPVSLSSAPDGTVERVVDQMYTDLGIRLFRTSYESDFSPNPDNYTISCALSPRICAWIRLTEAISKYKDVRVFASIWSPPHYMKNQVFDTLKEEEERSYFHFIRNITNIIKEKFGGLQIERVSPVNEPENIFAPWEHTNMSPKQLCRIVREMNDTLVSLCPENSYFWMSQLYINYTDQEGGVSCSEACDVYATHAYTLNIDYWSPYRLFAYYDPGRYERHTLKPIWMTEVSSTFPRLPTVSNQLTEALDLATNIVNFVGSTCVTRYYFWNMYTDGDSGESLIWGNFNGSRLEKTRENAEVPLYFPKTYFVYRHFTLASFGGQKQVEDCNLIVTPSSATSNQNPEQACLIFHDKQTNVSSIVAVNRGLDHYKFVGRVCSPDSHYCCTTEEFDWFCITSDTRDVLVLPKKAVCSCKSISFPTHIKMSRNVYDNEVI